MGDEEDSGVMNAGFTRADNEEICNQYNQNMNI
jgi:hypothetical protein